MTSQATPAPQAAGATLHLGGDAWCTPDLQPLLVPITQLTPYPGNARRGDQDAITSSVRDLGVWRAHVVQESTGHVLVGNHQLRALLDLGATHAPASMRACDDDTARAIALRDNHTSDLGGYDQGDLLALYRATDQTVGLEAAGLTSDDLAALEAAVGGWGQRVDPDEQPIPEPPPTPVTQEGDVWTLGRHRLMCGSSVDRDQVETLMDGEAPSLVHTDPPYGISIVNTNQVGGSKPVTIGKVGHAVGTPTGFGKVGTSRVVHTKWYQPVIGDETTATAVSHLALIRDLYPKADVVLWGGNHYTGDAHLPNASCWLVWDKQTGANTFADAELAWTNLPGSVRLFTHRWNGLLRDSERGSGARHHPTQKPVALAQWVHSRAHAEGPDAVIFDGFGGAGFVLLAAEQSKARARVMELSPGYVDVMCRRWQQLTGMQPTRDGVAYDFSQEVPQRA